MPEHSSTRLQKYWNIHSEMISESLENLLLLDVAWHQPTSVIGIQYFDCGLSDLRPFEHKEHAEK